MEQRLLLLLSLSKQIKIKHLLTKLIAWRLRTEILLLLALSVGLDSLVADLANHAYGEPRGWGVQRERTEGGGEGGP